MIARFCHGNESWHVTYQNADNLTLISKILTIKPSLPHLKKLWPPKVEKSDKNAVFWNLPSPSELDKNASYFI